MRWYLRAHRVLPSVTAGTVLMAASWWLAGTALPVPQLLDGRVAPVALELLFAVVYAPLVASSFAGAPLLVEHGARRPLWGADLVLSTLFCAPVVGVAAAAAIAGDTQVAADLTRNAAAVIGAALILLTVVGRQTAVTAPIGYFIAVCLLGAQPGGSARWWAIPRDPAVPATLLGGLALLLAGIACFCWRARSSASARQDQRHP